MKRFNLPLIVGGLILIIILTVSLFPELFTDKSPYNIQQLKFSTGNGTLEVAKAPFPPSEDYIFGSDELGRDIYSFIIHGTGLTILLGVLIALGRFLIAVPMALSAGFGNTGSKSIIRQFNMLFSAIPALLISVIILKLDFFTGLDKAWSVAAFVLILSLIGWPKIGSLIMERADVVNRQTFIKSEVAIGKSRFAIAVENVFPHLAPELLVLFFMEIARALSMIMQLGIFSIFVGFLRIILDTEGGVTFYNVSFEPEWAGMLSTSRNMVSVAPWTVLFPALAFFISVLGFNLFGEGLRNILQKRDSLFIPSLRKMLSLKFKYIWFGFSKKTKLTFFASVLLIAVLVIGMIFSGGREYHLEQVHYSLPEYDRVVFGTEECEETANFIAGEMKRLGLTALDSEEYTVKYETGKSVMILDASFVINSNGRETTAEFEKDYNFQYASEGKFSGQVYDATMEDMFSIKDYARFNDKFVLIDKAHYNDAAVNFFIQEITENSEIPGILLVNRSGEKTKGRFSGENPDIPVLSVSQELASYIIESEAQLNISVSLMNLRPEGINVIGFYEGEEGPQQEEAVIIGMGYNYRNAEQKEILEFSLQLMEALCNLEKNNRSLIFMFIDGTGSEALNGIHGIAAEFPYSSSKVKVYIDLTGLETVGFDNIKYSSAQAPFTRQYAWSLGHQIEDELQAENIDIVELETIFFGAEYYFTGSYSDNTMFFERGIATIILSSDDSGQGKHDIYDIGGIVLETIKNNNY